MQSWQPNKTIKSHRLQPQPLARRPICTRTRQQPLSHQRAHMRPAISADVSFHLPCCRRLHAFVHHHSEIPSPQNRLPIPPSNKLLVVSDHVNIVGLQKVYCPRAALKERTIWHSGVIHATYTPLLVSHPPGEIALSHYSCRELIASSSAASRLTPSRPYSVC